MGQYGWGYVEENNLIKAINTAIDHGINFFDTSDTYGLGKSEINLGEGLGNRRSEVVIASKFGVRVEKGKTFYDNSPEYIEKALFASMKRLRTDYIDLYQVHYRDGKTPLYTVVEKLEQLKKQGYIRHAGLCNVHKEDAEEIKASGDFFITVQDEYSLACRKNEQELKMYYKDCGMNSLTWGSLGQGILTGEYDANTVFGSDDRRSREIYVNFHGEKLKSNLRIVEVIRNIAETHNVSCAAVAIRFILDYLDDSIVLAGVKNEEEVLLNIASLGWHLTKDEIDSLDKISKE
ncbi:hypothetical protein JT05_06685 [Desulfosporosinus sp. Tol-M]|nr:hypothetical protein JT05_06685 [Desulfosporosinus sp. Tol-M]